MHGVPKEDAHTHTHTHSHTHTHTNRLVHTFRHTIYIKCTTASLASVWIQTECKQYMVRSAMLHLPSDYNVNGDQKAAASPIIPYQHQTEQHRAQVIASIVHVTTQNSQQRGPLYFYGFTAQRRPIPSAAMPYISHISLMCAVSVQPNPLDCAHYLIDIFIPVGVLTQTEISDRLGSRLRGTGGWLPALRISRVARVYRGTTSFRAGHRGTAALCKDERINC